MKTIIRNISKHIDNWQNKRRLKMNYQNQYNQIIENCKINPSVNTYTENHHIIPRCLSGDNSENNLVKVSTKEHYLLHHLLAKIYPENKSIFKAFKILRNRLHIDRTSSPYSCIRKCEYFGLSEETKQKMSENHSRYWKGKHLSEEHKRKISERQKGERHPNYGKTYKHSEEAKRKMSLSHIGKSPANKGIPHSTKTKQKIAEQIKGRIFVNNGIINKQVFPDNIPDGFVKGRLKTKIK